MNDRRDLRVFSRLIFGLSAHGDQTQYFSQFGKYACSLVELGPPASGVNPGPTGANLIPANLASGRKNGYVFTVTGIPAGYAVHATPILFGKTGHRTFYVDQRMIIRQNWGPELASADSPEFQ